MATGADAGDGGDDGAQRVHAPTSPPAETTGGQPAARLRPVPSAAFVSDVQRHEGVVPRWTRAEPEHGVEPIEYLRIARRRWVVIATTAVVAALLAALASPPKPLAAGPAVPVYRATNTLIRAPGGDLAFLLRSFSRDNSSPPLDLIAFLATRGEVPRRVAQRLNYGGDPVALARQVTIEPDPKVESLQITATDSDGKRAADLANTFASALNDYLTEKIQAAQQRLLDASIQRLQSLQAQMDSYDAAIAVGGPGVDVTRAQRDAAVRQYGLEYQHYEDLQAQAPSSGLITLEPATPIATGQAGGGTGPLAPLSNRPRRLLTSLVVGLLLGFGIALVLERFDTRLRGTEAVERAFNLPVVTEVPEVAWHRRRRREVLSFTQPSSEVAEAYRNLRTALLLLPAHLVPLVPERVTTGGDPEPNGGSVRHDGSPLGSEPRVVLVTSPGPRQGKTTTVANLAACLAESGRSVLVLSCDIRRPAVERYLAVKGDRGLAELAGGGVRDVKALPQVVEQSNIWGVKIVGCGSGVENPADFVAGLPNLIQGARDLADIVLLDVAPLLTANDALELVPSAESVVVVCREGGTPKESAERTSELLARVGAPVLGVVLVGTRRHSGPTYLDRAGLWLLGAGEGGLSQVAAWAGNVVSRLRRKLPALRRR